ncbi:MAG: hypothetical protein AMJ93_15970 [Anaerolineae bacterium SM23_84]|nr:MAG: hypothetical protein AMJ93_15970 [Anaerolineae bacterium SM23_84]
MSVNSYPAGAEIYLVPATVGIAQVDLDDVMLAGNRLGTAPLIHKLAAGTYYVATSFTPDLFTAAGYQLPTLSDPTFDDAFPFDGNAIQSTSFIAGDAIERLSKLYRVIMRAGESEALISIALPLPENQRGRLEPVLYPTLATVEALPICYTFHERMRDSIEKSLSENDLTVGSSMVDEMVGVLLRVGKVKLDTSAVDLTVQIDTEGTRLSISTRE